jgi:hypothetical protein
MAATVTTDCERVDRSFRSLQLADVYNTGKLENIDPRIKVSRRQEKSIFVGCCCKLLAVVFFTSMMFSQAFDVFYVSNEWYGWLNSSAHGAVKIPSPSLLRVSNYRGAQLRRR